MKLYFSHGKESGPWGSKIKRLADLAKAQGFDVDSIDYSDTFDPDIRVERLLDVVEDGEGCVLVGSSMGGYVSLVAAERLNAKGVFLLAPALYMPGYQRQVYNAATKVEVVHGWSDEVISVENSIQYAQQADCALHLISGDHRLNSSLDQIEPLFIAFLNSVR